MEMFRSDPLRMQLYHYIKEKLNSGEIKIGDKINQKEISERLKISKTPFHDCMVQLEAEGIVTILPCRGVVVRDRPFQELIQLYEVARALDASALKAGFYKIRKNALPRLRDIMKEADAVFGGEWDEKLLHKKDVEFHLAMLNECPSDELKKTAVKYRELVVDFPAKDINIPRSLEEVFWEEHKEMIKIIETGKPQDLAYFSEHVHWGWKGREEYIDCLYMLKPGTMAEYLENRMKESLDPDGETIF